MTMNTTTERAWNAFQHLRAERDRLRRDDGKRCIIFLNWRWYPAIVQAWDSDHNLRRVAIAMAREGVTNGPGFCRAPF